MKVKLDGRTEEGRSRLEFIRAAHRNSGSNKTGRQQQPLQTDTMEDYLEVIYELIQHKGYATAVDISNFLNVSAPSVTKMAQKLAETGYLKYEKYRGIVLTKEGTDIAQNIRNRHTLLVEFLKIIGVDDTTANIDAEGMEHHLHQETLKKLEEFVRDIRKQQSIGKK